MSHVVSPLGGILQFGWTPRGTAAGGGGGGPATGTDYYPKDARHVLGLSKPYIRFGHKPVGASVGGGGGPGTGTDYYPRDNRYLSFTQPYIRFGHKPVGASAGGGGGGGGGGDEYIIYARRHGRR